MRLALFEPDIPQNTGTLIRLTACLNLQIDIIEPCGFTFSERALKRSGMDYLEQAQIVRHISWESFQTTVGDSRIILLTTKAETAYTDFIFQNTDILLLGRESAGVPDAVHDRANAQLLIPMQNTVRSINVAVAGAMVLGEALRQTNGFPQ